MIHLNEIIIQGNQWTPAGGWKPEQVRLIGRDILHAPNVKLRWEIGLVYLNPGRDVNTARVAFDFLRDQLKQSLSKLDAAEQKRSEFILECLQDKTWCADPVLLKILLYEDRIEVFTGSNHPEWPTAEMSDWPREWTFFRMNRYIQWNTEPISASHYWGDQPRNGPCPDGSWPRLYSRLMGCVCCTNGLFLMNFERMWSCGLPKIALGVLDNGRTVEVIIPNLPRSGRVLHEVAREINPESIDLKKWEGTKARSRVPGLLTTIRLLEVPGELVRLSQTEEWPLDEQFAAEEIAGAMASAILAETENPATFVSRLNSLGEIGRLGIELKNYIEKLSPDGRWENRNGEWCFTGGFVKIRPCINGEPRLTMTLVGIQNPENIEDRGLPVEKVSLFCRRYKIIGINQFDLACKYVSAAKQGYRSTGAWNRGAGHAGNRYAGLRGKK